jgi:hypothetical protein
VATLSVTHHQLGNIYTEAGDVGRALPHFLEAIRYEERRGNIFGAAGTRFNVAIMLMQADRLEDAWDYATAALRNYETYGDRAVEEIQATRGLIELIEKKIQEQGG